ncbi:hypothetical protein [Kineococcus sp. SYSU DK006]|uniref:hypothetical protein n=1 Tax=Kineococcus sp. SYSU DK006 TaxID=3383127 RepID=UPI003D7CF597
MDTTSTSLQTTVGSQDFAVPPSHLLIAFAVLTVTILGISLALRAARWVIHKTQVASWLQKKIEAARWMPEKPRGRLAFLLANLHGRCSLTVNEEAH